LRIFLKPDAALRYPNLAYPGGAFGILVETPTGSPFTYRVTIGLSYAYPLRTLTCTLTVAADGTFTATGDV
jgi:hypothetical protein